jgi:ABC-type Na+ transport system ATPase subunit NatA
MESDYNTLMYQYLTAKSTLEQLEALRELDREEYAKAQEELFKALDRVNNYTRRPFTYQD